MFVKVKKLKKLRKLIEAQGDQLYAICELLQTHGEMLMAIRQDVQDVITEVKDGTDLVAARIEALVAASKGLTEEEKGSFKVVTDHLRAIGTNPNEPVPVLPGS